MSTEARRRSERLRAINLNGRGYISDSLGWTVPQLETWMQSDYIQPLLQRWYEACVAEPTSFNHVLDMINNGQYRTPRNAFEREIVNLCLARGAKLAHCTPPRHIVDLRANVVYLWARTVFLVVSQSARNDKDLKHGAQADPTHAYNIVTDLLFIVFHSIAYRGEFSCYEALIHSRTTEAKPTHARSDTRRALRKPTTEASETERPSLKAAASSKHTSVADQQPQRPLRSKARFGQTFSMAKPSSTRTLRPRTLSKYSLRKQHTRPSYRLR